MVICTEENGAAAGLAELRAAFNLEQAGTRDKAGVMDDLTVNHYNRFAAKRAGIYEKSEMSSLQEVLLRYFRAGTELLEIGCGSGRDAAFLIARERHVTATDASPGMIAQAKAAHPELADRFIHVPFPPPVAHDVLKRTFDGIYAIAVIMHIPDEEVFEFAFQIKSLLKPGGIVLLSFSTGRSGIADGRDDAGRLFRERSRGEIQLLFERLGFRLIDSTGNEDCRSREITWHTLVMKLAEGAGNGPVDQIETIINRDKKDATYKLALLRALCDIAQTEYRQATWELDGNVSVPLGLVAEKWLFYYWPIVEADCGRVGPGVAIPQKRGLEINKPIAFRRELLALISHCRQGLGGLDAFYQDFRGGLLATETAALADAAVNKIAQTIVSGPVRYSGGALEATGSFFRREGAITCRGRCIDSASSADSLGKIQVQGDVWRELSLLGHWISQSIVLRWAELTHEISNRIVSVADVIDKLLVVPQLGRDQLRIRKLYKELPDLRCVWTGDPIHGGTDFEVDHMIPFALWHNNDLWNLMPATRKANNAKRDKLISRERLAAGRSRIIDYWQAGHAWMPMRFHLELERTLLGRPIQHNNWEDTAFQALCESVETLACQRGIPRWPEAKGNVVLGAKLRKSQVPKKQRCEILPFEEIEAARYVTALPLVADLAAGNPYDGFRTRTLHADDWIKVPLEWVKPNHFIVKVDGDSMAPQVADGDYVICEWHRSVRGNNMIVIRGGSESAENPGFALKRIEETESDWLFHSDNADYPDAPPLSKTDVPAYPILGLAVYNLTRRARIW